MIEKGVAGRIHNFTAIGQNGFKEETEKLGQMVSEMLEISSIDSGFIEMNFEIINLSEFCFGILHQYQLILEKYQTEIRIEDDIFVSGDWKYLERVVKNILNNAIQHTVTSV